MAYPPGNVFQQLKGLRIVLSSENLNWYNGHAAGCTQRYYFLLNGPINFAFLTRTPEPRIKYYLVDFTTIFNG